MKKTRELINNAENKATQSRLIEYRSYFNLIIRFLFDELSEEGVVTYSQVKREPKRYFRIYEQLNIYKEGYFPIRVLTEQELKYINIASDIFSKKLSSLGLDLDEGKLMPDAQPAIVVEDPNHPVNRYISKYQNLISINAFRTRNFTIFYNEYHEVVYDKYKDYVYLRPKIQFSDFEHDKNRRYVQDVILNFMHKFKDTNKHYLKLLNKR